MSSLFTEPVPQHFFNCYVETALWATTDENDPDGRSLDRTYTADDLAPETLRTMRAECADFLAYIRDEYGIDLPPCAMGNAGRDFWLTRNRHGAGYWDGDWESLGADLTAAAHTFGEVYLYADDGLIYQT